ncbi:MAG: allophanate hydrolase subunit 1 [Cytophagales bacterium]|nr:allophanate hydrolase subunit 1 [Cytophagales bacterium]
MLPRYIQIGSSGYEAMPLGERSVLFQLVSPMVSPREIYYQAESIKKMLGTQVADMVLAYASFCLHLAEGSALDLIAHLPEKIRSPTAHGSVSTFVWPICYELGLDWLRLEQHTGLSREAIIHHHLQAEYEVAMIGFLPGFVYLSGLDVRLACPRLENPRVHVPAGAVGIGGSQAGLYSLPSPGGWNLLGMTDINITALESPPNPGDRVRWRRATQDELICLNS